jgi:hypothetical protein
VLDAVLAFSDEWAEYIIDMEDRTWRIFRGQDIADLGDLARVVRRLIGMDGVERTLNLAEAVLTRLDGDHPRYNDYDRMCQMYTTAEQEASIGRLEQLRRDDLQRLADGLAEAPATGF